MTKHIHKSPLRRRSASPKLRDSLRNEDAGQSSEKRKRLDDTTNVSPASMSPAPAQPKRNKHRGRRHEASSRTRNEGVSEDHRGRDIEQQTDNGEERKRSRHSEKDGEKKFKRSRTEIGDGRKSKVEDKRIPKKSVRKTSKKDKTCEREDTSAPSSSKKSRNRVNKGSCKERREDEQESDSKSRNRSSHHSRSSLTTQSAKLGSSSSRHHAGDRLSTLLLQSLILEPTSDTEFEALLPKAFLFTNSVKRSMPTQCRENIQPNKIKNEEAVMSKSEVSGKDQLEANILSNLSRGLQKEACKAESWGAECAVDIDFGELFGECEKDKRTALALATTVKLTRQTDANLMVLPWQDLLPIRGGEDENGRRSPDVDNEFPIGLAALVSAGISARLLGDRLASELEEKGLKLPTKIEAFEETAKSEIFNELSWRKSLLGVRSTS